MTAPAPARSLAEQFAPALARRSVARAPVFTTMRGGALALSVVVHAGLVAVGLHDAHATAAPAPPASAALVETPAPELEPLPPEVAPNPSREPEVAPARVTARAAQPSHGALERAAASTEPHVDSTLPAAPSPAPLVTAAANAAPRFVIPAAAVQAALAVNARPALAPGSPVAAASAPLSEHEVDVAARLVAGEPPAYTASAEAAGVEASVPVELVIDETGGVKNAVVLGHAGYGLDEAALGAVRKYRFSPARRGGKVVSVRMRWVVRFELG